MELKGGAQLVSVTRKAFHNFYIEGLKGDNAETKSKEISHTTQHGGAVY